MNVDAIFDAVGKASRLVHLHDEIRKKQHQLRSVLNKRCGNCDKWMKSTCIPEKKHKQFKSCDSFGCKDFVICWHSNKLSKQFESELSELKSKIENFSQ